MKAFTLTAKELAGSNRNGAIDDFHRVFRIDVVVEKDSIQMVDFVLQDNRIKTPGGDLFLLAR